MSEIHELISKYVEEVMVKTYAEIELLTPDAIKTGCGIRVTNTSANERLSYDVEICADVPLGEVNWVAYS